MASGINIYSSFQISKINILDIQNNYFGYPKWNICCTQLWISGIIISDIQNDYSGYPELDVYFGYPK